jgi:hypothetical protein
MTYISSAERADLIKALRETADKLERGEAPGYKGTPGHA